MLPIWNLVHTFMPQMEPCYTRAQENTERWKTYEETQDDMQVYELREVAYKTNAIQALSIKKGAN